MFFLGIDPDELRMLDRRVFGFGVDRRSLAGVDSGDFGRSGPGAIEQKIREIVDEAIDEPPVIRRMMLMTIPRIAGYVFAPVSFFLCEGEDGTLVALVAEVRNTFGEKHHYVAELGGEPDGWMTCRIPKRFHVSPFLRTSGEYDVRLRLDGDEFDIEIDLREGEQAVFSAGMRGTGRPLTTSSLMTTLARMPLFATTIMMRIHWQALVLAAKRIGTHEKPVPTHPMTTPARRRSVWYALRAGFVRMARRPSTGTQLIAEGDA